MQFSLRLGAMALAAMLTVVRCTRRITGRCSGLQPRQIQKVDGVSISASTGAAARPRISKRSSPTA
jgi:hypothetical protein